MARTEQINELLMSELANLIAQHINLEHGLITIVYVDCSPDLRQAKIGISVLPENFTGTALKELNQHSRAFSQAIIKKTRLRQVPKLHWTADFTEAKAAEIEKILREDREEIEQAKKQS